MFFLGTDPVAAPAPPAVKLVETARQTYGLYAHYPTADTTGTPNYYQWQMAPGYVGPAVPAPPSYNYPDLASARQAMANFYAAQRAATAPVAYQAPYALPQTLPPYAISPSTSYVEVETPVYQKPLFWAGIGAAALGAYLLARRRR
jgi:hypothetical protein